MEIKTSNGDFIEVENNEYLKFKYNDDEYKVLFKRINTIGNYLLDDVKLHSILRSIALGLAVIFLVFIIKLFFDPYLSWEGKSYEEVNRMPDAFLWVFFVFSFCGFLVCNHRIKKIKSIDYTKSDYELPISVIVNDDPKRKEFKSYVICRGSIQELKEIKSILDTFKDKSALV